MLVAQSCPTVCDSMHCSPPDSSVHRIHQARILQWVAIPFSRGSSWPRDWTWVSCISGRFFTVWAAREALFCNQRSHPIMQQLEKSPLAAAKTQSSQKKKKHVLYTHTHTHTHTHAHTHTRTHIGKGFNACLSIPIRYQKPWFYAVKYISMDVL